MKEFDEEEFARRVSKILLRLGITPNLSGFGYIKESVYLIAQDSAFTVNFNKKLYPKLALMYGKNVCAIEHGIRHAIEVSYNSEKTIVLNDLLGIAYATKHYKPTARELILVIYEKVSVLN